MLPKAHKLASPAQFRRTMAARTRAGSRTLVVHVAARTELAFSGGPRFGLIVSKAVGNAVTRHSVSRKLRHVVAAGVDTLARDTDVVVRALPPAAAASSAELARDYEQALAAALKKLRAKGK
ncbi:ribonuclease P protein component [Corynebacterium sanguinis]|uniref:Ribonuclease P protein component n=1 Tax=Corynebacterium sanguinis TaxID=2594913 RepID=A0A6C1TUF2_9CORY|nr:MULTISPECIES: ribonuclease P protein component [Corynebacterium]MCT1412756.1 ribonuclease P protein component [Corynebacterium sanguinis]MCT1415056.1 ribonuclease P protein component [Corynebacterium sanguinis]MCT1426742.1 ribonuclease P protein component [Corynebacterium sanguinis]MCT1445208.1 ribonuclease P protein component [Corynebacterium sanguinis]MCT1464509.1 ribonuclease P protein component [Corynebacterium sanguinis]